MQCSWLKALIYIETLCVSLVPIIVRNRLFILSPIRLVCYSSSEGSHVRLDFSTSDIMLLHYLNWTVENNLKLSGITLGVLQVSIMRERSLYRKR